MDNFKSLLTLEQAIKYPLDTGWCMSEQGSKFISIHYILLIEICLRQLLISASKTPQFSAASEQRVFVYRVT